MALQEFIELGSVPLGEPSRLSNAAIGRLK